MTIVGSDLSEPSRLASTLQGLFDPTIVYSPHPLSDAARAARWMPDCIIVPVTPQDSAIEVREMIEAAGTTRVLFLAESLPLRAPVARLIREASDAVVLRTESPTVIEATLVALLASPSADA
ncbi:MAG TPA: hypothetical protein VIH21_12115 [Dehalococcoidia bacterium]